LKKIKVLALCDTPTAATGLAQVSKNIFQGLAKTGKYDIQIVGINFRGDPYNREKHPYEIFPAQPQGARDMYGRDRLMSALSGNQTKEGLKGPWDIIFTLQDPFIMEGLGLNYPFAEQLRVTAEMWKRTVPSTEWFKWIAYWPIDSFVKENWVTRSIALPHYSVAYCNWGKSQILKWDRKNLEVNFNLKATDSGENMKARMPIEPLKNRMPVIHHGVDLKTFKVLPSKETKEFRKKYFKGKVKDDTYLIVNISRNQPRKDIPRTMAVFAAFKKIVPNSYLYLHMKDEDMGGAITEIARNFNLIPGEDYTLPANFDAGTGVPIETINKIYNAADLCVTTTLGEGWGFITTESMATKTPLVAPNITAMLDIFDSYVPKGMKLNEWLDKKGFKQVRGIPVKAGSNSSEWFCLGLEDNERIRPLTNVDDMVSKMVWAYQNKRKVDEIVERAYKWVQGQNWELKVKEWDKLFQRAYKDLEKERRMADDVEKAGRNDPCPCGSGKKTKKCHGAIDKTNKFSDWIKKEGNKKDDRQKQHRT